MLSQLLAAAAAALLAALPIAAPAVPAATAGQPQPPTRVLLVGVAGLTWDDVTPQTTPALWGLVHGGAASGTLSIYAGVNSCDADGWLTVSTGVPTNARDGDRCVNPTADPSGGSAVMTDWDQVQRLQQVSPFRPELGRLTAALEAAGRCVSAFGNGGAVTAATADGTVERYRATATVQQVTDGCPVSVVDAGSITGSGQREAADRVVAELTGSLPGGTTAIIFSVPSGSRPERAMGVAVAYRPGDASTEPRYLTSPTTQWPGVVALIDLPPTVLHLVGVPPTSTWAGSPWTTVPAPADVTSVPAALAVIGDRDDVLRSVTWFFLGSAVLAGVLLLLLSEVSATGNRRGSRLVRQVARSPRVGTWLVAFPVATFALGALPWWRTPWPEAALYGAALALTAAIGELLGLLLRRRGVAAAALAATSALTLLVVGDLVTGQGISRSSPLAPSPLSGGRFYGLSNATSASLAIATVWAATLLSAHLLARRHRSAAFAAFAVFTAAVVLVTALPTAGADVGGALTLLPTFAVTGVYLFRLRVTLWRGIVITAVCVLVPLAMGLADYSRPAEQRTHLGKFVELAVSGQAWELVSRKAGYAAGSLLSAMSLVTLIVLVLLGYRLLALLRHRPLPGMWSGLATSRALGTAVLGSWVAMVTGSLLNDYGIRMATIGLVLLVPLVLLTLPRAAELEPALPSHGGIAPDASTPVEDGQPCPR